MKKIILITLIISSCSAFAQKGNINVELISYRVPITYSISMEDPEKVNAYDVYTELFGNWFRNKFGPAEYNLFINEIYNAATTGKITVYDPYLTEIKGTKVNFTPITPAEVKSIGSSVDSLQITYPYPPYDVHDTVIVREFDIYNIVAIDFLETWTINSASMKMTKKVIAFAPVMSMYDDYGVLRGTLPMFWVKM